MNHENITKAVHAAGFLRNDLLAALKSASAVESLLLLPMIERATRIEQEVDALRLALEAQS